MFDCLHKTLFHYHHCADLYEGTIFLHAYQLYALGCVSKIKSILSIIVYSVYRALCLQLTQFSWDDRENVYFISSSSLNRKYAPLTYWGPVTHICVGKLATGGSNNGLSPSRRQAIIWKKKAGMFFYFTLRNKFQWNIYRNHIFSFKKMYIKISSAKCRPFCLGLNVLTIV